MPRKNGENAQQTIVTMLSDFGVRVNPSSGKYIVLAVEGSCMCVGSHYLQEDMLAQRSSNGFVYLRLYIATNIASRCSSTAALYSACMSR